MKSPDCRCKQGAIWIAAAIVVSVSAASMAFAEEYAKTLALSADANQVVMARDGLKFMTHPGKMNFQILGPYGNYEFYLNLQDSTLESYAVQSDTVEEKRVVLKARRQCKGDDQFDFYMTLTARLDAPGIEVETAARNTGRYASRIYYFARLLPIHAGYYYDQHGEQNAARKEIPMQRWLFLPTSNTKGGYVLIMPEAPTFTLSTLHPRADWRKTGWYFIPEHDRRFQPDCESRMQFRIFPAADAAAAAAGMQHQKE